jgi:hypothetical protein
MKAFLRTQKRIKTMLEKIKSEWEYFAAGTSRMKVIRGWIVRSVLGDSTCMVFVPDEHHRWAIDDSLI